MLQAQALSDLRVVEYGDLVAGPYCARLLADGGADVVKVETPAGDASRGRGPFAGDTPNPEGSGLYLYLNANKRGIVLDLQQQGDATTLRRLLRQADVLVVNHQPSSIEALGLRRHQLQELNPRLIVTAITPFGLTGPWRDFAGDDLIALASGGLSHASPGVPDMVTDPEAEPPLRAATPVAEFVAGLQAAMATMVAVTARGIRGTACEVDVSLQEAVAMVMTWEVANASYMTPKRREPMVFGAMPNTYLPCKDGYVVIVGFLEQHWQGIVKVMGEPDWARSEVFATAAERARNWDALQPFMLEWTMARTGEEIAELAQGRGLPCFPAYTVGQMMASDQVKAREFFLTHELPNGEEVQLPGFPIRMGTTPWTLRRPAPRLGQHTEEVLKEWLGASPAELPDVLPSSAT